MAAAVRPAGCTQVAAMAAAGRPGANEHVNYTIYTFCPNGKLQNKYFCHLQKLYTRKAAAQSRL
jgi:hypothetical protein